MRLPKTPPAIYRSNFSQDKFSFKFLVLANRLELLRLTALVPKTSVSTVTQSHCYH